MDDEITPNVDRLNILAAAMLQGIHDSGMTLAVFHSYTFKSRFYIAETGITVGSIELVEVETDDSGMDEHMPFPHTKSHEGPATDPKDFDHWACWCVDGDKCEVWFRQ